MNIFEQFDAKFDVEGLKSDIKEAKDNKGAGDFKEVPHGKYEVKLEKLELSTSKKGDPMVVVWFRILEGEFKNNLIFYYQVITQGFQIHLVNELLRSMDTGIEVEFDGFANYSDKLMDIFEAVDGKLEFGLEYGEGKKGFSTYKITDVFDVE